MQKKLSVRAFTLVEVMISVTIVTLIAGVVLFNYATFSDNLALSAAGQEMVINLRQAQTYGLAVKEVATGSGNFNAGYGIYIDIASDPTSYYLFVDNNNDHIYDVGNGCGSGTTECVQRFTFRDKVTVDSFCDDRTCPPFGDPSVVAMSVTFLRPNPDAIINFLDDRGNIIGSASAGQIVLVSPKRKTTTVTVQNAGQISIQ